ncbi:hypothetical protein ABPG75_000885 [Micractinium tetrahymenae]
MAAKALIDSPETVVTAAIDGLVSSNPHLARLDGYPDIKVVIDATFDKSSSVAVISGGGSGHEPAMAGYVGRGMLAAAVCGEVFASPSEDAVLAAIRAVTGPAGCLLIVMNYTGDRLNFGAAAERAKVEGLKVEMVVTADDCALKAKAAVGRRGIAGTVLVHKIAGATAAAGGSLEEVKAAAEGAAASIGTMGASLSGCTVFGQPSSDRLGPQEFEMGLGIHGEPGAYRERMRPMSGIVDEMVSRIAGETDSYLPVEKGDRVVLLVNNLGSTTPLEMHGAAAAAARLVQSQLNATVERLYIGPFMTSLGMHGLSVTLLRGANEAIMKLLDAPTEAPAWPSAPAIYAPDKAPLPLPTGPNDETEEQAAGAAAGSGTDTEQAQTVRRCLEAACRALHAAEAELNALDGKVGDGDCGSTLAKGASAIQAALQSGALPLGDPASTALALASLAGRSMGGTSGAIYKLCMTAAGASLRQQGQQGLTLPAAAAALLAGVAAISKYGGAQLGDRTMLDALGPAAEALNVMANDWQAAEAAADAAASAAEAGAEATCSMTAAAGRASYVPAEQQEGTPDPGARAVAIWLRAVANAL